jgi:hypothetical protein
VAKLKYEKYILRQTKPHAEISAVTPALLEGRKDWGGVQLRMNWMYISQPNLMVKEPHSHDFDEFLCFSGCNTTDPFDFGAEIELSLGREGEKHVIDAATIICIPKGLVHDPLCFRRVDKPILFCNIYLAPKYLRKALSK